MNRRDVVMKIINILKLHGFIYKTHPILVENKGYCWHGDIWVVFGETDHTVTLYDWQRVTHRKRGKCFVLETKLNDFKQSFELVMTAIRMAHERSKTR